MLKELTLERIFNPDFVSASDIVDRLKRAFGIKFECVLGDHLPNPELFSQRTVVLGEVSPDNIHTPYPDLTKPVSIPGYLQEGKDAKDPVFPGAEILKRDSVRFSALEWAMVEPALVFATDSRPDYVEPDKQKGSNLLDQAAVGSSIVAGLGKANPTLSRRRFLQLSAIAGGFAAIASAQSQQISSPQEEPDTRLVFSFSNSVELRTKVMTVNTLALQIEAQNVGDRGLFFAGSGHSKIETYLSEPDKIRSELAHEVQVRLTQLFSNFSADPSSAKELATLKSFSQHFSPVLMRVNTTDKDPLVILEDLQSKFLSTGQSASVIFLKELMKLGSEHGYSLQFENFAKEILETVFARYAYQNGPYVCVNSNQNTVRPYAIGFAGCFDDDSEALRLGKFTVFISKGNIVHVVKDFGKNSSSD